MAYAATHTVVSPEMLILPAPLLRIRVLTKMSHSTMSRRTEFRGRREVYILRIGSPKAPLSHIGGTGASRWLAQQALGRIILRRDEMKLKSHTRRHVMERLCLL